MIQQHIEKLANKVVNDLHYKRISIFIKEIVKKANPVMDFYIYYYIMI